MVGGFEDGPGCETEWGTCLDLVLGLGMQDIDALSLGKVAGTLQVWED